MGLNNIIFATPFLPDGRDPNGDNDSGRYDAAELDTGEIVVYGADEDRIILRGLESREKACEQARKIANRPPQDMPRLEDRIDDPKLLKIMREAEPEHVGPTLQMIFRQHGLTVEECEQFTNFPAQDITDVLEERAIIDPEMELAIRQYAIAKIDIDFSEGLLLRIQEGSMFSERRI